MIKVLSLAGSQGALIGVSQRPVGREGKRKKVIQKSVGGQGYVGRIVWAQDGERKKIEKTHHTQHTHTQTKH
jgi:hypothetical protein